jgi:hypothetical protein
MVYACIPPSVYQFRIIMQGINALIWRRPLIRNDMSLATLYAALQIVLARNDTHLHSFYMHGKAYGSPRPGGLTSMLMRATCRSRRCASIGGRA